MKYQITVHLLGKQKSAPEKKRTHAGQIMRMSETVQENMSQAADIVDALQKQGWLCESELYEVVCTQPAGLTLPNGIKAYLLEHAIDPASVDIEAVESDDEEAEF